MCFDITTYSYSTALFPLVFNEFYVREKSLSTGVERKASIQYIYISSIESILCCSRPPLDADVLILGNHIGIRISFNCALIFHWDFINISVQS